MLTFLRPRCSLSHHVCLHRVRLNACLPFSSSHPELHKGPNAERLQLARLNRMLVHLERNIRATRHRSDYSVADTIIHPFLELESFSDSARRVAYDKFVSVLLEHGCWDDATSVYQRMLKDSVAPSERLRSRMMAMPLIETAIRAENPVEGYGALLSRQITDDTCFRQTVAILTSQVYDAELVEGLCNSYIQSRPQDWRPTPNFFAVLDQLRAWSQRKHDSTKAKLHQSGRSIQETPKHQLSRAYAAVLKDLGDSSRKNLPSRGEILESMQKHNVALTSETMNALISTDLRRLRFDGAFAFYHALMANRSPKLLPNAHSYGLLFKLSRRIHAPRSMFSRRLKRTENTVPPLRLFKDMFECHLIQSLGRVKNRTSVINEYSLNNALHAFLARRDYPAAYVVALTFSRCGLWPNLRTYEILFHHLASRLRVALRSPTERPWAENLLAVGETSSTSGWPLPNPTSQLDPNLSFHDHVMLRLLWIASGSNCPMHTLDQQMEFMIDPDNLLHRSLRSPRKITRMHFRFPTFSMLSDGPAFVGGTLPDRSLDKFNAVPLQRVIRRAIEPLPGFRVSDLIKRAKDLMIAPSSALERPLGKSDMRDRQ